MTELSWIAIIIAAISATGVTGSFLLNWYQSKRLADQKITEWTINYNEKLTELAANVGTAKDMKELNIFFITYVNKLDELASLNVRGIMSDQVCDFFYYFLRDGHDSIEWFQKNQGSAFPYGEGLTDLVDWYKKHKKKSERKRREPAAVQAYKRIAESQK